MQLLQRNITAWVQELLDISPIVVIEGARQVGKSTLTGMIDNANTTFTTMDDDLTRTFAHDDPAGFLSSAKEGRLVIDEIQRCPELILPLKAVVDNDRRPGRFVLTGSANLLRLPGAQESLAGRAMTARLHPFSQGELEGHKEDWVSWLLSPDRRSRPFKRHHAPHSRGIPTRSVHVTSRTNRMAQGLRQQTGPARCLRHGTDPNPHPWQVTPTAGGCPPGPSWYRTGLRTNSTWHAGPWFAISIS